MARSRRQGAALRRRYSRWDRRVVREASPRCRRLPPGSDEQLTCLTQSITKTVAGARVTEFHLGRSVDPANRASKFRADELVYLMDTSSVPRASAVEDALLKNFRGHPKSANVRADAAGPTVPGRQHVYLALRLAQAKNKSG
jgi:hypothetical protein